MFIKIFSYMYNTRRKQKKKKKKNRINGITQIKSKD